MKRNQYSILNLLWATLFVATLLGGYRVSSDQYHDLCRCRNELITVQHQMRGLTQTVYGDREAARVEIKILERRLELEIQRVQTLQQRIGGMDAEARRHLPCEGSEK